MRGSNPSFTTGASYNHRVSASYNTQNNSISNPVGRGSNNVAGTLASIKEDGNSDL